MQSWLPVTSWQQCRCHQVLLRGGGGGGGGGGVVLVPACRSTMQGGTKEYSCRELRGQIMSYLSYKGANLAVFCYTLKARSGGGGGGGGVISWIYM